MKILVMDFLVRFKTMEAVEASTLIKVGPQLTLRMLVKPFLIIINELPQSL